MKNKLVIVLIREQILGMKNENKQNIIDTLSSMPCALEADDVTDFCSLAQYYALKTPVSFRRVSDLNILYNYWEYECKVIVFKLEGESTAPTWLLPVDIAGD